MSTSSSGPDRAAMAEYLEGVLEEELALSKSHVSSWGRVAMSAVDMDDAIKLMQVYQQQGHLGADINAKTNHLGYGSYMWTPWIHQFLGDTCLHICMKQKKPRCVSVLLLLEAATDIENDAGYTAERLAPETMGQTLIDLRRHAMRVLLTTLPAHHFELLPDQFLHRNTEKEAWRLMRQGRLAYSEDHLLPNGGKPKSKFEKKDENAWRIQRNTMWDTIENLRRQTLRRSKIKHDQHLRETGLAAAAANALKNAAKADEKYSSYYKRYSKSAGFRYLRFAARNQKDLSSSASENDDNSDVRTVSSAVSAAGTNLTGGGLADIENLLPHRYITVVSTATNLKCVRIGPEELQGLASALRTDDLVTELTISSAGMSDAGAVSLCPVIPTMSSLTYMDLSYNAITDGGCAAIAKAIEKTRAVRRVTLRGNRIGDKGAELLICGLSASPSVRILNLSKNKISEGFKSEIAERIATENAEKKQKYDEDEHFPDSPSRTGSYGGDSISSGDSHSRSRANSPTRAPSSPDAWKDELHASLLSPPGSPVGRRGGAGSRGGSRGRLGSRSRSPSRGASFRFVFVPMEVTL